MILWKLFLVLLLQFELSQVYHFSFCLHLFHSSLGDVRHFFILYPPSEVHWNFPTDFARPGICSRTYPRSGLWTKTLAFSVLSIISMPETCTGCCRSSFIGLVMNMTFVSAEQTFRKLTNTVSAERDRNREIRRCEDSCWWQGSLQAGCNYTWEII